MKYPTFSMKTIAALAVLTVLAVSPATAEQADRDKPMNAEADALRYDDLKQTSVFTGNVVITKGTTIIRGERVDVTQDPEGYQKAIVIAPAGKLAFYRKKRDGVDEYIEGEGLRIEYDSRPDLVKFIGSAVMRRYKGAILSDESTGSQINYDNVTDVFTVDSNAQNKSVTNPTGRVRALLSPRNAASGAAGSTPVTPPAPPASLRPSNTLGNEKN
ncbi:MAG: lipopolysaccharide transport periplasmic protein LptA [Pseudomonadota bacterium]